MSTFHPRRLLLATAVASLALPVVAEEHGFLEDASANLNLRNFFFNRNYTNPTKAHSWRGWKMLMVLDLLLLGLCRWRPWCGAMRGR